MYFAFVFHFSHAGGFRNFLERIKNLAFSVQVMFNLLDGISDFNSSMYLLFFLRKLVENSLAVP